MLSIPTIIIGTTATALSFLAAGDTLCEPGSDDGDGLKYGVAVFTLFVSVLGGVATLYSFHSKMSQNISAAGNFENLARRAQVKIYTPDKLWQHSELCLEVIAAEFAHLTTSSPLL